MSLYTGPNNGAVAYYRDSAIVSGDRRQTAEMASLTDPDMLLAMNIARGANDPEFLQNLILEAGYWLNSSELSYYQDQRARAEAIQSYGLEMLRNFEFRSIPQFQAVGRNGTETVQFYLGNHWSPEDEAFRIDSGMKPYSWPSFKPLVNAFLGEMVAQQTDYRTIPLNTRSEPRVEVANKALQWVAQSNRIPAIKIDAARDAVLYGYSVIGTRMHPMDPQGAIQIFRVRPEEVMFDLNSATDSTLANVKHFWRGTWQDRVRLAAEFPEWRNEILRPSGLFVATSGFEMGYTMIRPKVRTPAGDNHVTTATDPQMDMMYGRLLFKREFYVRRWVDRLVVTDPFAGRTYNCTSQQQAASQQLLLEQYYSKTQLWGNMSESLRMRVFSARPAMVEVIDQLIFIGDQLVRINSDDEGGLPFVPCCPEFYDGSLGAYFEQAKDPQRWEDRLMAAIDDREAGAKGGMVINEQWIKGPWNTDQEMRDFFNQPNWKIVINEQDPEFNIDRAIKYVVPPPDNQNYDALLRYVSQINVNSYGGQNRQGLAAFAGQSGKSAEELRSAGSTLTMSVVQKIAESDRLVGMRVLYLLQYLHPAVQMRTYDEDLQPVFFSLLDQGMESLGDYDFDVEVKQILASPSERQARIKRIENILGYDPSLIEGVLPFLLKNSDIDYTERQQIEQFVNDRVKARNQEAADNMKMAKDKVQGDLDTQKGNLTIKAREQAWLEQNAPKTTLTGKLSMDPLMTADLINWAAENVRGFAAHPAMIIAGQAAKDLLEQRKLTMQQVEEDAHTPQYKKDAIENNVAVKEAHQTAKDTANRAMRETRSGNAT